MSTVNEQKSVKEIINFNENVEDSIENETTSMLDTNLKQFTVIR